MVVMNLGLGFFFLAEWFCLLPSFVGVLCEGFISLFIEKEMKDHITQQQASTNTEILSSIPQMWLKYWFVASQACLRSSVINNTGETLFPFAYPFMVDKNKITESEYGQWDGRCFSVEKDYS